MAWGTLGFLWAIFTAGTLVNQVNRLSQGPVVNAVVQVSSIALAGATRKQTVMRIERLNGRWLVPSLAFSTLWQPKERPLCAGQRWLLQLRLRPIHGNLNEGGNDRQRWAMSQRQPLTAQVKSAVLLDQNCSWRQRIITYAENNIGTLRFKAVLLALAFGERAALEPALRTLMLKTGIAHLMAISGLHVAMVAILIWGLLRAMQFFLPAKLIDYRFPLIISWLGALGYVWLAGAHPPAVRTGLALTLWMLLRIRGIHCSSWQIWLWCVGLILVCDPLAVLSDSFWLSATAVFCLIFWFEWVPLNPRFGSGWHWAPLRWLHIQLGITLLLVPMQAGLFHGLTLNAIPANLWAVPLVSLITVPLFCWQWWRYFPDVERWDYGGWRILRWQGFLPHYTICKLVGSISVPHPWLSVLSVGYWCFFGVSTGGCVMHRRWQLWRCVACSGVRENRHTAGV